ncbi:MAG: DNA translocase FtsK [Clostridiales bacterium]|nr:DNA translocase FtsK [Clostridiales bacterium]
MAQKTKNKKTAPRGASKKSTSPKKGSEKTESRSLWSQIAPYLMLVGAIFLIVCFVGGAGENPGIVIGFIYKLLTGLFGGSAFVIPVFLAYIAIAWLADKADTILGMRTGFAIASVILASMLLEIMSPIDSFSMINMYRRGAELLGGGMIGGLLGEFFLVCFQKVGSYVLIIAMLILSILLAAGITPKYVYVYFSAKAKESRLRRQEARESGAIAAAFRDPDEIPRRVPDRTVYPEPAPAPVVHGRRKKFQTDVPIDFEDPAESPAVLAEADAPQVNPEAALFEEVLERTRQEKTPQELQAEAEIFAQGEDESHVCTSAPEHEEQFEEEASQVDPDSAGLLDQLADAYLGAGDGNDGNNTHPEPAAELPLQRDTVATAEPAKPEPVPEPEYHFPPLSLLSAADHKKSDNIREELHENASRLVSVLASFNVKTKIVGASRGPTITRYELLPEAGTRVRSIANLVDDIALNLATTGVRIEAPIPGKAAVGIEVPNKTAETVYLRSLLETEPFQKNPSKITTSLGENVAGEPVIMDIKKMPHLLIAGATGMGKSVCINCLLISLLYKAKPSEVQLILIDPKKVEFNIYNGLPHLLVPVVSDPKKAAGSLTWAVNEMERRFGLIEAVGVRDIASFNEITQNDPEYEYMPQIVIVIDELADLMSTAPDDVETSIARLAAKARAAGMHLIIGTQRPSVDVITGVIKANIPSRIAFTVASQVDSRTIIDRSGAENLIGRGDMLYSPVGASKPMRVQGAFVSEKEVDAVVSYIKQYNAAGGTAYSDDVMKQIEEEAAMCGVKKGSGGAVSGDAGENDPLIRSALDVAFESGKVSTSLLQRRLSIGYGRAAKIIDKLEQMGYVSAPDGQKPRELLITKQDYMELVLKSEDPQE